MAAKKSVYRNPVYIVYTLSAILLFILGAAIVDGGTGPVEIAIFNVFNNLGDWLSWLMILFSIPGSLIAVFVVSLIPLFKKHYLNTAKILLGGIATYALAYGLKHLYIRPRPEVVLSDVKVYETSNATFGYPSGHMAVATFLALVTYYYLPRRYHKYLTWTVILVGISRMYLGMHLPMDLVGGFAVGLFMGSILNLIFGSKEIIVPKASTISKKLKNLGVAVATVKPASVDARGSSPFFVTLKDNGRLFVKVVGQDNNVADWLFKLWRKVVYRRLEDEVPFLSPKRQLEHESYVAGLALANGVRTPQIVGVFEVNKNLWAQAQVSIDGNSLDRVEPRLITDSVLGKMWEQVNILHRAHIVHRDLRAANVFLDSNKEPWLIDFGFSEASVKQSATDRDVIEMIASLSTLIGAKRAVASANRAIGGKGLKKIQPLLSYAILSGATTKLVKSQEGLFEKIKNEIEKLTGEENVELKKMNRFSIRTFFMMLFVLIAVYVFLPQIDSFKQSYGALKDANFPIVMVGLLFSIGTYICAALVYKLIAINPIPYLKTLLVQAAGSFNNRILPSGIGSLATNTSYLMKEGHSSIQAASLSALNNMFGFIGNMILLVLVAVFSKTPLDKVVPIKLPPVAAVLILMTVLSVIVALVMWQSMRKKIIKILKKSVDDLKILTEHPFRMTLALLVSMLSTSFYVLTLYASAQALGADLSLVQIFFVFCIGILAAAITPTPGGIGGAEAGLTAAFVSVGLTTDLALAISLVYRFLTYWFPILPGFIAFQIALRKKII